MATKKKTIKKKATSLAIPTGGPRPLPTPKPKPITPVTGKDWMTQLGITQEQIDKYMAAHKGQAFAGGSPFFNERTGGYSLPKDWDQVISGVPIKPQPGFPNRPEKPSGQIDYTKIPGWDKLTPQEQQLLKVMVDGLKSPFDVGSIPAFDFDEALATQASEAQYKPFFQEKLSDVFYQTQRAKQQAEEDYAKRLGISTEELRQSLEDITGQREQLGIQEQRGLEDIGLQRERGLKSLAESAAERGLTFSGIRGKEEQQFTGDIAKEQGRMQQDIARGFEDLSKGEYRTRTGFGTQSDLLAQARQRTLEDQARTESLAQRDITRQQQEAITGGVLQRRGEALQPYWYYFQKLAGGQ